MHTDYMEKKKNFWDHNTFRTFFSNRKFNSNFFWRHPHAKLSSGFTLIEVLITLTLIGVMATGIIVALNPLVQLQKAQDAKRKSDLSQIQKALETYYQDNGRYPLSSSDHKIKGLDNNAVAWGSSWLPYMSVLPKDPSSSKSYVYFSSSSDRQTYYIYASLDRGGNDPQACFASGNSCVSSATNNVATACGGNCNYGVSSPNVSP